MSSTIVGRIVSIIYWRMTPYSEGRNTPALFGQMGRKLLTDFWKQEMDQCPNQT
jgi:hypothetical protein